MNTPQPQQILKKLKENGSLECLTAKEDGMFLNWCVMNEYPEELVNYYENNDDKVKKIFLELECDLDGKLSILKDIFIGADLAKTFIKYIEVKKEATSEKKLPLNEAYNKALNNRLNKVLNKYYLKVCNLILENKDKADDESVKIFVEKFPLENTELSIEEFDRNLFSLLEITYRGYELAEKFIDWHCKKRDSNIITCIKSCEFKSSTYKKTINLIKNEAKNKNADAQSFLSIGLDNTEIKQDERDYWRLQAAKNGSVDSIQMVFYEYFNDDKLDEALELVKKYDENRSNFIYRIHDPRHQLYLVASNKIQSKELEEKNKRIEEAKKILEEKNKALEASQGKMQKLVEQFTHTLGNVIFPQTIYQVAERLKNNPDYHKDVLLLHEAYHSEITIKLQGDLLRQRYANTNPEEFRRLIRRCRKTTNGAGDFKSIEAILDYAASRVTARFLNQHYAGLNSIRDKILSKKNVSLNDLKQQFEDDILLNTSKSPSAIAWINENLRPVKITEISPLWKKVFILSESHAEALLFGYFSEILFNAIKYADHDKDEFLTLSFDEKTINGKMYLSCSWLNPVKDKAPSMLGTGKGLDAIQEDLKQLNDTENQEESLLIYRQENKFQVTLFFQKDLLVNESPIVKLKRKANTE